MQNRSDSASLLYGGLVDEVLADEALMFNATNPWRWAISDHAGSVQDVIAVANASATSLSRVSYKQYDSYGRVITETGGTSAANDVIFGYTGQQFDDATGLALHGAGSGSGRYYDPKLGRFISEDDGFIDGYHLYRYAGNDPLNHIDPTGMAMQSLGGGNFNSTTTGYSSFGYGSGQSIASSIGGPAVNPGSINWGSNSPYSTATTAPRYNPSSSFNTSHLAAMSSVLANPSAITRPAPIIAAMPGASPRYRYQTDAGTVAGAFEIGLAQGVTNVGRGLGNTGRELGYSVVDAGNDLLSTTALLATGNEWGYRGHYSGVGQALDRNQLTVGGFYRETAKTTAADLVTLGTYSQVRTGYQLYQGEITVDEASTQLGTNALMSLAGAKGLKGTRYGDAPLQNLPGMAWRDAGGPQALAAASRIQVTFDNAALSTNGLGGVRVGLRAANDQLEHGLRDRGSRLGQVQGREFRPDQLELYEFDTNVPGHVRGWLQNERRRVEQGRAEGPRTPPGFELGHGRSTPAREGYDYSNSRLQGIDLNRLEERIRRQAGKP